MNTKKIRSKVLETCPFFDKKQDKIVFPYKPTGDKVFVWQHVAPEKIGSIFVPECTKQIYTLPIGVILAIGNGYVTKSGHWRSTELKIGDVVLFDRTVPWKTFLEGSDQKLYKVRFMGEKDVRLLFTDDGEEVGVIQSSLDWTE